MEVKLNFDTINVFEENNPNYIKVLMLKGEKGDKGDPGSIVNTYSTSTSDGYSANYFNQHALKVEDKNNMGKLIVEKISGKNIFDGELELGNYSTSTGEKTYSSSYVRNKNFIPVDELKNYKFSSNGNEISMYVFEYKQDFTYNLTERKTINAGSYLTTNSGTKYINFRIVDASTDVNVKIQIEKGTTVTSYQYFNTTQMGNIVVDDVTGKNLYPYGNNLPNQYTYLFPVTAGETYTLSFEGQATSSQRVFFRNYGDANHSTTAIDAEQVYVGTTPNNYSITLTTTANGYLFIATASGLSAYTFANIMVEKGSEATSYTPYETYANSESEVYSTNEIKIGRWINGEPLYQKVISGTSPTVTTSGTSVSQDYATGLTNVGIAFLSEGFILSGTQKIPFNYFNNSGNYIKAYLKSSANLTLTSDSAGYSASTFYAVIKYTKTTD